MRTIYICEEEELLYDKIIEAVGWEYDSSGVLINRFFPLVTGRKRLIRAQAGEFKFDDTNYNVFRPIFSYNQAQLLLRSYYFRDEDELLPTDLDTEISTFISDYSRPPRYGAKAINEYGMIRLIEGFRSEAEAITVLIYDLLTNGESIRGLIHRIHDARHDYFAKHKKPK